VAAYLALAAACVGVPRFGRRRRLAAIRRHDAADRAQAAAVRRLRGRSRRPAIALILGCLAVTALWPAGGDAGDVGPATGLRVSVLDVGQGDAILLQPGRAPAILVDGGPAGEGLAAMLRAAGVERLGAAVVTHDQSDHAGGIGELLGTMAIGRLLFSHLDRSTLVEARGAGVPTRRLFEGNVLRSGQLRLEVLWPPAAVRGGGDPNRLALVLLARWRSFSMLLAADAEAESTPLEPGPIDVLKVAHHGSDDAGLGALLDRARPRLAVISVGMGNPFGHPTPATLATLADRGVDALRTDRDGTVVLEVDRGALRVSAGG
jgi:competence protein ComEC